MSVTLTLVSKQANSSTVIGSPIGLLLTLTYATVVAGGLTVTLVTKN